MGDLISITTKPVSTRYDQAHAAILGYLLADRQTPKFSDAVDRLIDLTISASSEPSRSRSDERAKAILARFHRLIGDDLGLADAIVDSLLNDIDPVNGDDDDDDAA
jgi:hypothetical protein